MTSSAGTRILLVDESSAQAHWIQALLADAGGGLELIHVETVAQALECLQNTPFDAALLASLPDGEGLQSLERLVAGYPSLPILILADKEDESLALAGLRQGAEDYLVRKTLSGPRLIRAIRYAQARKQAEDSLRSSETKYRTLFHANRDAVVTLTPEGRFVSGNPAAIELVGCRDESHLTSLTNMDVSPEYQPDGMPSSVKGPQMMAIALEQGSHFFDWVSKRLDGTEFYSSVLLTRMQVEGQQLLQATTRDITEQKRGAEALRHEKLLSETIINSLPEIFYLLDEHGKLIRWNKNLAKVTGYSAAEMEGLEAGEFFAGFEQTFISQRVQIALTEGVANSEAHLVCKDGRRIPYYFTGLRAVLDGKPCVLGTGVDITERKRAEETLRFTNAILRTQQETSPDGILVVAEDSRVISFNQRFLDMWGISADYVQTHRDEQIMQSVLYQLSQPAEFLARVRYLYEHREEKSREELALVDGHTFDRYSAPMFGPDGHYYGRIWYFRDITEQKQAEAALRREQQFSQLLLENLPGIFYLYTYPENRLLLWNKQHESLLGFEAAEMQGRFLGDWHVPEAQEAVLKAVDEVMEKGSNSVEANLVAKDGHYIPFFLTGVRFEAQGRRFLMGIGVDMTERRRTEEELRKYREHLEELVEHRTVELVLARDQARAAEAQAEAASRAKSVFLATMSHELRTPLNAVLGFSQLLRADATLNDHQKESLDLINRSGLHLLGLINDILQLSRIEAGHCEKEESDFDLGDTLDSIQEMMGSRARAKGLRFCLERAASLPRYVRTDERKLKQVLINLVGNAVKFTHTGGVTLRARAEDAGQHLWFEVEDTGPGMAPETVATLFEPFAQGGHDQEGAGLGLFISQKLVRLLGGEIVLRSQPGKGTWFAFDIRCESATAPENVPQLVYRVPRLANGQPPPRILVVEDTPESRLLMVKALRTTGFEVSQAANGLEAVQLFQKHPADLVLMDIRMPVMDGHEAIARIRATPQGKKTPIIAVTASAFDEDRQNILAMGSDDFVGKPVQCAEVLEKIRRLLGLSYTYVEEIEEKRETVNPADLTGMIASLPVELRDELAKRMLILDLEGFKASLPRVAQHAPLLAEALLGMADGYRLTELARLFSSPDGN